ERHGAVGHAGRHGYDEPFFPTSTAFRSPAGPLLRFAIWRQRRLAGSHARGATATGARAGRSAQAEQAYRERRHAAGWALAASHRVGRRQLAGLGDLEMAPPGA